MSKRSERKGRPTVQRDPGAFRPLVERHRRILRSSAERWDASGNDDEVVVMAGALRTLLGDGDRLLDRVVSIKRGLMFCDSTSGVTPPDGPPGKWRGAGGLAAIKLNPDELAVVPLFSTYAPGDEPPVRWGRFRAWWHDQQPVIQDNIRCSREFLIHEVANTDGVHVSSVLDAEYDSLRRGMTGIASHDHATGQATPLGSVVGPCVRQIAWELERTLQVGLDDPSGGSDTAD